MFNLLPFFKHTLKALQLVFISLLLLANTAFAQQANILVYGDSLSAGFGLQTGEDWPALLNQQLQRDNKPYRIINESISGETTSGGLARFTKALEQHKPNIVILELGANDGLRGQSLKTMKNNLSAMIEMAQQTKAQVLLVGIYIPPNYGKRYTEAFNKVYIDLQKQYELTFIPFLLEGVAGVNELMQNDGLHPNAKAQPIIKNTVLKSLTPLLRSAE
jgi:acyl-CoA thioesterase-1